MCTQVTAHINTHNTHTQAQAHTLHQKGLDMRKLMSNGGTTSCDQNTHLSMERRCPQNSERFNILFYFCIYLFIYCIHSNFETISDK